MILEEATCFIDQAGEIPTVRWISLTGGEPFLYPQLLESSVRHASDGGLQTECVTNCYWAETEHKAEEMLGGLVEAGLDGINISTDDFHQRHIPFERVRSCFNAAKNLGLKVVIMCATARSSALRAEEIKRLLGDEGIQILGAGVPRPTSHAIVVETGFTPAGRGDPRKRVADRREPRHRSLQPGPPGHRSSPIWESAPVLLRCEPCGRGDPGEFKGGRPLRDS
jgi:hypothetical protein